MTKVVHFILTDSTICTKEEINIDKCYEIVSLITKKIVKSNNQISLGKYPNSIFIYFPSLSNADEEERKDMEFISGKIPFNKIWFTHMDFHTITASKKLLNTLSNFYKEIYVADENENVYTLGQYLLEAKEY